MSRQDIYLSNLRVKYDIFLISKSKLQTFLILKLFSASNTNNLFSQLSATISQLSGVQIQHEISSAHSISIEFNVISVLCLLLFMIVELDLQSFAQVSIGISVHLIYSNIFSVQVQVSEENYVAKYSLLPIKYEQLYLWLGFLFYLLEFRQHQKLLTGFYTSILQNSSEPKKEEVILMNKPYLQSVLLLYFAIIYSYRFPETVPRIFTVLLYLIRIKYPAENPITKSINLTVIDFPFPFTESQYQRTYKKLTLNRGTQSSQTQQFDS